MKLLKPKFWNSKNNFISICLLPFSLIYKILFFIKKKITKEQSFDVPIVCIGNIFLGGTGKTPLAILLAKELCLQNKKVAIIKKYYRDQLDEYDLINDKFNFLFSETKRNKAIEAALQKDRNFMILDDGFQDFSIKKNLSIICFNSDQLLGNGRVLPSGPLREEIEAIKRAQIIVINGSKNLNFEEKILNISPNIKIFYSKYKTINTQLFENRKLLAFSGIGNPNNFFKLLNKNDFIICKNYEYPDHYEFSRSEIQKLVDISKKENLQIVTTEKDHFRIKKYNFNEIKFLKLELEIEGKNQLLKQILKL